MDRADESDAPRHPAGAPAGAPADAPADAGTADVTRPARTAVSAETERQAIEGRLYRMLVDHTYGVARHAWAEAADDLRAAWENHKTRYPERVQPTPHTTADGAWVAGQRRLSPEQNGDVSKACADTADEGRRDILPALQRVESADPKRRLAGLEHLIKGEDRMKEKVAERLTAKPGRTIQQAIDGISDRVRSTFVYSPEHYADGVRADVELLKAEGFELLRLKNLWSDEQYKGINSQWRRPETGLRFEMQFHTRESLEAKELTHEAYERIRSDAAPAERAELRQFQRTVNALLITPERTAEIEDYPENRHG
jgi:hypothetical protein